MIDTNWPQLPLNAREALRKAQLRGVASLTGEERAVLDTVPAGDLVTTRCRTCRTPVTPGHTGHDGPLVDGEETFWCDQCCPCMEGDDVSDEIEVTVRLTPEDVEAIRLQAAAAPVELRGWSEKLVAALPDPAPERTEYALYRLDKNGHHVTADEVLVAAHSLRVGDRIEWAPGDWREIAKVELNDPEHAIHTFYVGDQRATYRGWDLVAVRR